MKTPEQYQAEIKKLFEQTLTLSYEQQALLEAIENAPHAGRCAQYRQYKGCTCWKSRALSTYQARGKYADSEIGSEEFIGEKHQEAMEEP